MDKKITVDTTKHLLEKTINEEMAIIAGLSDALEAHKTYLQSLKSLRTVQQKKRRIEMPKNKKGAQFDLQTETEPWDFNTNEIKKTVPQIQALVKGVDRAPEICLIQNTLEVLQNLVGGYIEAIDLDKGVILICNEEGKLESLPKNFNLPWNDYIVGTAVFVSSDGEGDFIGLSDTQIDYVKKFIKGE